MSSSSFNTLGDIGTINRLFDDEHQKHGKDEDEEDLEDNTTSFGPNRFTRSRIEKKTNTVSKKKSRQIEFFFTLASRYQSEYE